ncbi:alpha/beta fold hydrolase [Mycobacterium avium]|jgi:pimeloyl-ACP methyl ester carboxylesterase|uniref:Hydrolase, alpha/beta fold family protein n=2 Tax=Mycobacterium avium TaxID=1764 RepID=A0A0H2ZXE0_MYCA1|nr:alpha/beta hydrolase [Mycobacterium avium]TXA39351.1 alpha/beta hydrolase [Mycobacterium tuberculosis variant bovis]ABK66638.1 hydrolase, alpha/beta fold family protein [Mycobacterium avium 104]KDP06914.1 alpha/beta hydrolase [Mycobacterium avium subsp. hominissuis 101]MBZ4507898.1 alpha/beta hydrolase [Mycobacterium avium subsp. hominissuis]MBZ4517409.1 alpha/beta hydrolase [Mycobacterium avium subsp. hominissuis]
MASPAASTPQAALTIPADDITMAADAFGDPADPPVVLLHGGGQTRHSWKATAADLGGLGWYALTVDLRGHGDSGWSADGRYGLDRFASDVVRVTEFLARPPVLVGASLGGNASLAALGSRPDLALGLVLVDVSPFLQPSGTNRIRDFMVSHAEEGFGTLEEVADAVAAYLPHRPRPRNLDGLRKNLRLRDGRWYWHWDPAFMASPTDLPVQRDQLVDPARLGAAASSLRLPTLLVRGGESDVLSVDDAVRFLELVPHAEFASVAGAHHMVAGDDNAVFEDVLGDFLARRVRSRLNLLNHR